MRQNKVSKLLIVALAIIASANVLGAQDLCPTGFQPMAYTRDELGLRHITSCFNPVTGEIIGHWYSLNAFSNSAWVEGRAFVIGNISPQAQFQAVQGGANYATETLSASIITPAGTTTHNMNAFATYAADYSSSQGTGGTVSSYHQCIAFVNGSNCFANNLVLQDVPGLTSGVALQNEIDVEPMNPSTAYAGLSAYNVYLFAPNSGQFGSAFNVGIGGGKLGIWGTAFQTQNGAANFFAQIGKLNSSGASNSQTIYLTANNGSTDIGSKIYSDSSGSLDFDSNGGSLALIKNGSYVAAIAFGTSAPTGACNTGSLYLNSAGSSGSVFYACVASAWVDIK